MADEVLEKPTEQIVENDQTPKETVAEEDSTLLSSSKEDGGSDGDKQKDDSVKDDVSRETIVPEKYDLKLEEGVEIDNNLLNTLTPVFKELKLSNEAVNKLAAAYAPIVKNQVERQQEAAINNWKEIKDGWAKETKEMLGANSAKELSFAAKFINKMTDNPQEATELRQLLDETGIGNNKLLVKMLVKAGKSISEDSFVEPNNKLTSGDDVSILFPTMAKK